jgi:phosphatidate cytidylyltransferase
MENGKFLIWYIIWAAWGTDTFAYYVGINFGKHKLTKVSPNKSVEGSIGGILGAIVFSLVYTIAINHYTDLNLIYWQIGILAGILSIFGQIGDLAASSIKRYVGVKDFGNIIPGHGGMLDRIDSIIFIAPFAYILINLIMYIQ